MGKPEILAVDIGNTRIACATFNQGVLMESWHHASTEAQAAARDIAERKPGVIAVSSVVPEAAITISAAATAAGKKVIDIRAGHPALPGVYPTLGADRIANAVAAMQIYGKERASVVIDLGTATTLTAVDRNGAFAGGFITLGLGKTLTMLAQATAQLPHASPRSTVERQLGKDTESSIVHGTLLGHIGLIENWIRIARRQLGDITTVATGGWSDLIARHSNCFDVTEPLLTLKGVYLIAEAEVVQAGQV